jgi:excisionase family DNA binding protein
MSRLARFEALVLLTPTEVAQLFRVDPKTVKRWALAGRLRSVRTPGGHQRFFKTEIDALLHGTLNVREDDRRNDMDAAL